MIEINYAYINDYNNQAFLLVQDKSHICQFDIDRHLSKCYMYSNSIGTYKKAKTFHMALYWQTSVTIFYFFSDICQNIIVVVVY